MSTPATVTRTTIDDPAVRGDGTRPIRADVGDICVVSTDQGGYMIGEVDQVDNVGTALRMKTGSGLMTVSNSWRRIEKRENFTPTVRAAIGWCSTLEAVESRLRPHYKPKAHR